MEQILEHTNQEREREREEERERERKREREREREEERERERGGGGGGGGGEEREREPERERVRERADVVSHPDTNKSFGNEGGEGDVAVEGSEGWDGIDDASCFIEHNLLGDALGNDRLGDVKIQSNIFFEDVLEISQNLKHTLNLALMYPSST